MPLALQAFQALQNCKIPYQDFITKRGIMTSVLPLLLLSFFARVGKSMPPVQDSSPLPVGMAAWPCLDPVKFGAIANDPEAWLTNTGSFQRTLDYAAEGRGRGIVCVSEGDYSTADLSLPSNIVLRLNEGARLITRQGNTTSALINIRDQANVTIVGPGTLYGNAEEYIDHYDPKDNRFQPSSGDGSRPAVLKTYNVTDLQLLGVKVENASDWHIHLQMSRNVLIDGIIVRGDSRFPNNDGIDPDSCVNVTIRNSLIDVADDGICPKASKALGPLKGLSVYNCTIRSKSHAIKFGSNTDTEMSDILFDNITIVDSNSGLAIQQRSGGDIHNVTWSNINLETRYQAPRWWGNGEPISITAEQRNPGDVIGRTYDIKFINITMRSENGAYISGLSHGVQDVLFENIHLTIDRWANYSTGLGPACYASGENHTAIECMGTHDRRPALRDGEHCSYYCRGKAKADGFYFENVTNVRVTNVHVTYAKQQGGRPAWFGDCFAHDSKSKIHYEATTCILNL